MRRENYMREEMRDNYIVLFGLKVMFAHIRN